MATVPLVVGVPCNEQGRWSAFWTCFAELERPSGSKIRICRGASPADNRNRIIDYTLSVGADWLFWLDDDLTFKPDVLLRLLALGESGYPWLVGLSMHRKFPKALWFHRNDPDLSALVDGSALPDPASVMPIAGSTFGGMLIRTDLLRRIQPPYTTIGQIGNPEQWNDDLYFSQKVRAAGYQLFGVPAVRFGHITAIERWPYHDGAEWHLVLAQGTEPLAMLPCVETEQVEP